MQDRQRPLFLEDCALGATLLVPSALWLRIAKTAYTSARKPLSMVWKSLVLGQRQRSACPTRFQLMGAYIGSRLPPAPVEARSSATAEFA